MRSIFRLCPKYLSLFEIRRAGSEYESFRTLRQVLRCRDVGSVIFWEYNLSGTGNRWSNRKYKKMTL